MLYILRPLIYAALVHQVEIYRSQRASSAASTTAPTDSTAPSVGSGGVRGIFNRVLDNFTMDALLNVVALAVSFVSPCSTAFVTYSCNG
jgi:hypothetical protein